LAVLTSFQSEGVIITDLVMRIAPAIPIVTIDTGRLPASTLEMIATVEAHYGIHVERIVPDAAEVQSMMSAHGVRFVSRQRIRRGCFAVISGK
jgi:phosphoadenosine phosphosulfate reductase